MFEIETVYHSWGEITSLPCYGKVLAGASPRPTHWLKSAIYRGAHWCSRKRRKSDIIHRKAYKGLFQLDFSVGMTYFVISVFSSVPMGSVYAISSMHV